MDVLRARQRIGNRPSILRKNLHPLSAIARAKRVQGNRDWIGNLQKDGGAAWRKDLARVATRKGLNLLLCAAGERGEMMAAVGGDAAPIEVLLVEDSEG